MNGSNSKRLRTAGVLTRGTKSIRDLCTGRGLEHPPHQKVWCSIRKILSLNVVKADLLGSKLRNSSEKAKMFLFPFSI